MPNDFAVVDRTTFFLEHCSGKSVLHLGCTNYPYTEESIRENMLLHSKLEKVAGELYGLDADQAGVDELLRLGSTNILKADLENLEDLDLDKTFDIILAG